MTDFYDCQFKTGDRICWPCRAGSKLWLNSGVVESIVDNKLFVRKESSGRATTLKNLKTVVIVSRAAA